jgi:hypothetical protein
LALENTKKELAELALNLERYRGDLAAAWDEHWTQEYQGWKRARRAQLAEVKKLVDMGRKKLNLAIDL